MYRKIILLCIVLLKMSIPVAGGEWIKKIETDKARYEPQGIVLFNIQLQKTVPDLSIEIIYYRLDSIILKEKIAGVIQLSTWWEWTAPLKDFCGYLVKISLKQGNNILEESTIGVDVSSDWTKFPRYGFLSFFGSLRPTTISDNISKLNRFHINGLQFYDWHYKHHQPIKGTPDTPAVSWMDIANRTISLLTLQRYIDTAHTKNMKAMAYNLLYGAYEDAAIDGVPDKWRMFTDYHHQNPDYHDLPNSWASDIYLMDPSNTEWQDYIINEMKGAFKALKFDGWHGDQLGDRGSRYNNMGTMINVPSGFKSLLIKAKDSLNCDLVMNAVNQYAQKSIAESPVSFLYTEVWEPNTTYDKLAQVILENEKYSGTSNSVIAAYIHKALSNTPGLFNTPAVLLADAVIFAFGGYHLELGEHMLCSEYFPINNLAMSEELSDKLTIYYDFLVAYQNLLRGGGEIINEQIKTSLSDLKFSTWSRSASVWNFVRSFENKKIFHLLNFSDAATLDWRDNQKIQKSPQVKKDIPVYYLTKQKVKKIWFASPDYNNALPVDLQYTIKEDSVLFKIPSLEYWDMVVMEFYSLNTDVSGSPEMNKIGFHLEQNYPNPFNPETVITYHLPEPADVSLVIYDLLGNEVRTLVNANMHSGSHSVTLNAGYLSSGTYFYILTAGDKKACKKLLILK